MAYIFGNVPKLKMPSEITPLLKYFDPTVQGKAYCINEYVWDICDRDLGEKLTPPKIVQGRFRTFYHFKDVQFEA